MSDNDVNSNLIEAQGGVGVVATGGGNRAPGGDGVVDDDDDG